MLFCGKHPAYSSASKYAATHVSKHYYDAPLILRCEANLCSSGSIALLSNGAWYL